MNIDSLDNVIQLLRHQCNCRHPWCWLDTVCHALHIRCHWVCDKHDAYILRGT